MFCTDSEAELLLPSPITSVVLPIIARMNSWVYTIIFFFQHLFHKITSYKIIKIRVENGLKQYQIVEYN